MSLGWTSTGADRVVGPDNWFWDQVQYDPDLLRAVLFSFSGAYGWQSLNDHNYNPALWTMMIELWGALIIFAISQSDRFLRDAYMPLLFCIAFVSLFAPIVGCFFAGALIALAERDGFALKPTRRVSALATLLLVGSLVGAAFVLLIDKNMAQLAWLAMGVFIGVRYSEPAQRFLNLPVSQFMGHISFPLYLTQFMIMISFEPWLILWAQQTGNLTLTDATLIGIASIAVCLVVAVLFLPIETGTLDLIRRIDRYRADRTRKSVVAAAS